MRSLHLHIGLHKTGTSYIQAMLARNADRLLAAGIGIGPYIDRRDGESRPMRRAIGTEGIGAVMARLAASPGEQVVVSSEQLCEALRDPHFAVALRDAARPHFVPRIILFLRRQDHLKESLFAQVVKNWYEGSIADENHYAYDHARRVADLQDVFGAENVTPALYRDPGPNDILGDLFAAMGVERPRDLEEVGLRNVSLHRRKLLFLSQVPKPVPEIQDVAHLMTRVVAQSRAIADDGGRFLMSPRARHDLVARYLDGNRALVERHGLAGAAGAGAFAEAPDPDAPWSPPAPITRGEFAAVLAETLKFCATERRNRYGARMTIRIARTLPVMGWRMFVAPPPRRSSRPPRSDLLPA